MTSEDGLAALLERSFARASPADANAAIERQRQARGTEHAPAVSWEAVLPTPGGWEALLGSALPRLVYFLDCRGATLPDARGVFVSLFVGDTLYFLEVKDVIDAASRASGLAPAQMVRRWGAAAPR